MKFLVTTSFPLFQDRTDLSTYLHICDSSSDLSIPLTSPEAVDVWICNGNEVSNPLLDQWLDQANNIPKSMLVRDAAAIPRLRRYANGRAFEVAKFPEQKDTTAEWEASILREAEMLHTRSRVQASTPPLKLTKDHDRKTSVLLVGAGIVNLMTADLLVRRGYQVRIVEASPDPRTCTDWTRLGVTTCGGNARMFTYTEADNYNEKGSQLYSNMRTIFRKTSLSGGWSVKSPDHFTDTERAWVDHFEKVPAWLGQTFRENMFEINRDSGKLWKEWMENSSELFEDVELRQDILRLYVESVAVDASVRLNTHLGTLIKSPPLEEFLDTYPGLRPAAASDHLAGGITVDGFTVNIHPFVEKLMNRIAQHGGEFLWDCEVQNIQRNAKGEVTSLESQHGSLEADHFVISPGANGNKLLRGTASENLIQGVLGVWLQIPNLEPRMQHSMKIHRRGHLVEDINITVAKDPATGEDILQFGGGYGYVGLDRPAADSPELMALFNELAEVARIYFPRGHALAKERGSLWPGQNYKYCIRPFTATGLGLFEQIPTAKGGKLIITGGNNTGGFAQGPSIAQAVERALVGEQDPMHVLFHPDRGRLPTAVTYHCRFPEPQPSLRSAEARQPLKLLVLCSDGPQHRYLRYRLDQTFPNYRCVVETSEGQVRQLVQKRRWVDAFWQKYHDLRRYYFGYSNQRKEYFDRLVPQDHTSPTPDLTVESVNSRKVWDAVEKWQPEITIVSGTKYIGRKLIDRAGLMINLHTGHLPDYKGNHCIFFALYDGEVEKVSSTLHQLTPLLDGGDVLDRVVPPILPSDNEETLYTRCMHMAMDRVIKHAEQFSWGTRLAFVKQENIGRTFRHRDRTPGKEMWLWWKVGAFGLLRGWQRRSQKIE